MANKNNLKTRRYSSCGVILTCRKTIPPPPSIAVETRCHSAEAIGLDTGANHGFGAGENDWLGAEAYIHPLR